MKFVPTYRDENYIDFIILMYQYEGWAIKLALRPSMVYGASILM
jgi:hypothetical protein